MIDAICRLCLVALNPDDSGCSVYNEKFQKALDSVFTFQIRLEEDLPVHTCKRCSWNVLDFQSYSELVQKNQEKLQRGLLQNVQNKSTIAIGEDNVSTDRAINDDANESNVAMDFESSQFSLENDSLYANASHIDSELCSDAVELVFEIHPDSPSVLMLEDGADNQYADAIHEEYLIEPDGSDHTTMEPDDKQNPVKEQTVVDSYDVEEPAQKKKKISSLGCASAKLKVSVSDLPNSSNVWPNTREEADHTLNAHASEKHPCGHCEKKFVSKWQLEYHRKQHIVLQCPFCKISLPGRTLSLHVATHQNALKCDSCNKKFISQRDFKCHKSDCIKRRPHT